MLVVVTLTELSVIKPIRCCVTQEWLDTWCQDTVCLVTPWTRLHAWNQLEKVRSLAIASSHCISPGT